MVTRLFFLIFLLKKNPRLRTLLVTVPFDLTVKVLLFIGKVFHLSYNAVNIIIWYMIFPMFWMAILDYKFHRILFVPIWLVLCLGLGYVQRKKSTASAICYSGCLKNSSFLLAITTCGLSLSAYSYHC